VALVALLSVACQGLAAPPPTGRPVPSPVYRLLRVVDGDTVVLDGTTGPVTVRLIGVDTPESVHPTRPVERFGRESAAFLKTLIGDKPLRLEYEPGPSRRDRYGRTLGYLYREPDGLFVNREIIARGYGHAYTKYPFAFLDDFRATERAAREGRLGLWAPEPPPATPGHDDTVFITRTGTKYHRAGCRYLAPEPLALPLERAAARFTACVVCSPSPAASQATANDSTMAEPDPTNVGNSERERPPHE
jgi:micrococcal nuclease